MDAPHIKAFTFSVCRHICDPAARTYLPHAPLHGGGGWTRKRSAPIHPFRFPPEIFTPTAKQYRRRCWPPRPSRLVGPGSTGRGPSLPAPKSPTLSGQGTRQPGPDRCSSRKGRGPLLGGSPPGSWASACVRLDPLARPTDGRWRLHASRALRAGTCATVRRGRARSGELSPPGG